ncbi:MAG: M56 family metallopeptidase [Actinomycetota bacterium]|nr:M56 family metallopeptidase [Actinomycetota bacterium]
MKPALLMFGYAAAMALLAPAPLARLTGPGVHPRLGLAAWLVAMSSALAAMIVAVSFLVTDAVVSWPSFARTFCQSVTDGYCSPEVYRSALLEFQLAAAAAATVTAILLAWRYGRQLQRSGRRSRAHAEAARITGYRFTSTGIPRPTTAVVLETPQPAVYCMAGRPAVIVLTRGALAVLEPPQLLAVLAHERAHLAGRHHVLVKLSRGLLGSFPGVPLFTLGAVEVGRLAELRADDAAARHSGRAALVTALVAMATGHRLPVPRGSLAATGGAVTARVQRLLEPPSRSRRACHGLVLTGVIIAIAAASAALPVFG